MNGRDAGAGAGADAGVGEDGGAGVRIGASAATDLAGCRVGRGGVV